MGKFINQKSLSRELQELIDREDRFAIYMYQKYLDIINVSKKLEKL